MSPPYTKRRKTVGSGYIFKEEKTCRGAESRIAFPIEEKTVGHRTPVGFLPLGKRGAGVSPATHYTAERGVAFPIEENLPRGRGIRYSFPIEEKMDFAQNRRFLTLDYKIPADDINASENGKFCPVLML